MALDKEVLTTQIVQLREELDVGKKHILHRVLEREEASQSALQALEFLLKTNFEVMRD